MNRHDAPGSPSGVVGVPGGSGRDVLIGVVGRAHGLRGEVTVRPTTDFVDVRFAPGASVRTASESLRVVHHRWQQATLVVRFEQLTDRAQAEALRGAELWAEDSAPLDTDPDEILDRDLIGLEVRVAEEVRGRVQGVRHLPAQDLLVISTPTGERLVPFVTDLVPEIDVTNGWLRVADMPGLLEDID